MKNNNAYPSLPNTWSLVRLGDFVISEKGKKPKYEINEKTPVFNIPYIDIEAFEKGVVKSWTDGKGCKLSNENDFLMVWDGSRSGLVGRGVNGALGSTLIRINFPHIYNPYAYYFLKSKFLEINTRAKGSGTPHVDPELLWNYDFPIPPYNEQVRIVAKVEELFSELNMGLENLKKTQELLKVYRQALLKNAFEGKLTEEWRNKNLRSASSKPKTLTDQKHEITTLPPIPLEWEYASLGQFIKCIEAGKSFKCEEREPTSHEVGVAKVSAVTWGEYNESESKTCNDPTKINSRLYINEGDFLFSRANTIDLVGACVIVKQVKKNIMLSDKTLRIKFNISDPTYILWYLRSITGRNEIMKRSTGNQDSMRNIGQERIRSILLPLCSEGEQLEIIRILNEKLLGIEDLERKTNNELQRSQSIRQSILKKAFSGELVTHNSNDEPVSFLLDRIKSEKNDPSSSSKKSKKMQKVTL